MMISNKMIAYLKTRERGGHQENKMIRVLLLYPTGGVSARSLKFSQSN